MLHRLQTVAGRIIPVLETVAVDHHIAWAIKLGVRLNNVVLEIHRGGHALERRAWLVELADCQICPGFRLKIAVGVWIKIRDISHRQDLTSVHIHNNRSHGLGVVFFLRRSQRRLNIILNGGVDRQMHVLSLRSWDGFLDGLGNGVAVFVKFNDETPRCAGENIVELQLSAAEALVVQAAKAEHMAGFLVVWIFTRVFCCKADAQIIFFLELFGVLLFALAFQPGKVAGAAIDDLIDRRLCHVQTIADVLHDLIAAFRFTDHRRRDIDRHFFHADRQRFVVAVVNNPAVRRDLNVLQAIVDRIVAVFFTGQNLDIE